MFFAFALRIGDFDIDFIFENSIVKTNVGQLYDTNLLEFMIIIPDLFQVKKYILRSAFQCIIKRVRGIIHC